MASLSMMKETRQVLLLCSLNSARPTAIINCSQINFGKQYALIIQNVDYY